MSHLNPLGLPALDIGRDVNGRFRPGNPGGPGNPFARKVASLRKALLDCVSEQDIRDLAAVLKRQALEGDTASIRLVLQYCVGKPEPPRDPDRLDADEWGRLRQMSVPREEFEQVTESTPACLACHEAQTAWPCNLQESPLDETIHRIHARLNDANDPPAGLASPDAPVPDGPPPAQARPVSRGEPARPSADRGESPEGTRRDRRPSPRPPSPNGRLDEQQEQPPGQPPRAFPVPERHGQPPRN